MKFRASGQKENRQIGGLIFKKLADRKYMQFSIHNPFDGNFDNHPITSFFTLFAIIYFVIFILLYLATSLIGEE